MKRAMALASALKAALLWAVASLGSAHANVPPDPDDSAWLAARDAKESEPLQAYLVDFPTGRHVDKAFSKLLQRELLAAKFKDRDDKGRPDAFGPPGQPDIGPPGIY